MSGERRVSGARGWEVQALTVAGAAVVVQTALVVLVARFATLVRDRPERDGGPDRFLVELPFIVCFGVPLGLLVSLFLVLPTAAVAARLGRRFTGREAWWWVPVVAAVVAGAVVAGAGALGATGTGGGLRWLGGTAAITVAASLARLATRRVREGRPVGLTARTYAAGAGSVVAVYVIGGLLFGTGLVDEYRPPRVSADRLAGTWVDGRGGSLRLAPDGTATAVGVTDRDYTVGDADRTARRCDSTGTWTYTGDDNPWLQSVTIEVPGCAGSDWAALTISGTPHSPRLNVRYGDVDAPSWYTFTRRDEG
ncbi:hypothetical protein [Streptomyces sp. NPDC047928]|uniref:hypothetical protein n=1 Tax=unclassified Streptomyces TaxID=2593676 RepID=UPI003714704B